MIYYFTSYRCEKHLIVMSYQNHNYETEMREGSLFCSFEIDRPRRGGSRTALHVNKYVHPTRAVRELPLRSLLF